MVAVLNGRLEILKYLLENESDEEKCKYFLQSDIIIKCILTSIVIMMIKYRFQFLKQTYYLLHSN